MKKHDWEYTCEIETPEFPVKIGYEVIPEHTKRFRYRTCYKCGRKEEIKKFETLGFSVYKYFDVLKTPQTKEERKKRIMIPTALFVIMLITGVYIALHIYIYGYIYWYHFVFFVVVSITFLLVSNKILYEYNKITYREPDEFMVKSTS